MVKTIKYGVIMVCMLLCTVLVLACATNSPNDNAPATGENDAGLQEQSGELVEYIDYEESAVFDPNTGTAALSMENDMGISVGGEWFPIWQEASGLLRALGDDYNLSTAPSCVFEGEDKVFDFGGVFVLTNPDGDRDIWFSIYLENDLLSTARGIKVGDSLEDVFDAYGDRFYWEGDSILTYSISGIQGDDASPCIQFTIMDDLVAAIDIYYPTNVT